MIIVELKGYISPLHHLSQINYINTVKPSIAAVFSWKYVEKET